MPPKKALTIDEDSLSITTVHELLDQQKSFFKDLIEQQERNYKSFIQMFMDSTNIRIDNIMKDVQDLKNSLQYSQAELEDFNRKLNGNMDKLVSLSHEFAIFQTSIDKFSTKSEYLENQSRRNNILIDGIPDEKNESWQDTESKAKKLLAEKLELNPSTIEVERAHRNGKYEDGGRPRSIIMKLLRFKDKEEILKRAKSLKGTKIFINEDFSEKVRLRRKELLPQLKEAREHGNIAYLRYDQLIVHPPRPRG